MGYGGGYGNGMGYGGYGLGVTNGTLGNYIMWLQSVNYTLMSVGSLVQTFGLNAQSIFQVAQMGISALDYLVKIVKSELKYEREGKCR